MSINKKRKKRVFYHQNKKRKICILHHCIAHIVYVVFLL